MGGPGGSLSTQGSGAAVPALSLVGLTQGHLAGHVHVRGPAPWGLGWAQHPWHRAWDGPGGASLHKAMVALPPPPPRPLQAVP